MPALNLKTIVQCLFVTALILISYVLFNWGLMQFEKTTPRFVGAHWINPHQTLDVKEVVSSQFMRLESHTIRSPSTGEIIKGWLWADIFDVVNILVEDKATSKLLVFRQSKYGLVGDSLAMAGGMINPGEEPLEAAKRELLEEMGRISDQWIFLGKFRTDVNRGLGFCYSYLARSTVLSPNKKPPSDDMEPQTIVTLSRDELRTSLLNAQFQEAKWSNTASLGLLSLENAVAIPVENQNSNNKNDNNKNNNKKVEPRNRRPH